MRATSILAFLIFLAGAVAFANASDEKLTLDFGRIGTATLGMSQAEASAALGFELTAGYDVPEDERSCYQIYKKGVASPLLLLMMSHDKLVRIDVYDTGIHTAAGIAVGSTEKAVREAYGADVVVKPHFYTAGHYLVVSRASGVKLLFETDGTKVTAFHSGRKPQINYVEGCS